MLRIAILCVVFFACVAAQPCSGPPPVIDQNLFWDCKRTGDTANCNVKCPPGQDAMDEPTQTIWTNVTCSGNNNWPWLACVRAVDGCNMTGEFPCPCILGDWGTWSKCVQNCTDPNLQGEMCRFRPITGPEYNGGGCPSSRSSCRPCQGAPDECQGPCKDMLCRNGGECLISAENRAYCKCPKGAYGRNCETLDPCLENPCQNSANCTTRFTTPYCACPPGFTGATCNTTITNVCKPSPCANNGICHGDFGKPVCQCSDGFFGRWCNETAAPAPPVVKTCNSTALVRCMASAPVGESFNKTCGRYQVYGACAASSDCGSIGSIWCNGLFKAEIGCDIPQCAAQASACDAGSFATCYEKMKETKYASRCAYLVDYVKCGTISECPDLLKTICTSKQVSECSLKLCPYTVQSAALVDAEALTAVLEGQAREWVSGSIEDGNAGLTASSGNASSSTSPLMFVGAAMIVAAAAMVGVAVVLRNRRLQGEYHQMADVVATH